jgi:soluble lytic murein transglycosylase-like protein
MKLAKYALLLLLLIFANGSSALAVSAEQKKVLQENIHYFDVDTSSGNCSTVNLSGKDNAEKVWNYFKGQGLNDEQVAGIMGNMRQESSFNPEIIQNGGESKNPSDAGSGGWGLIQRKGCWRRSRIIGLCRLGQS